MVHLVPTPSLIKVERPRRNKEGGRSQKLILFKRGKAISGALIIKGNNQFLKPLIKVGITKKKIIIRAWAVTITL